MWYFLCYRMGSFTSATKILNDDCQDNDVQLPERLSRLELLEHCSKALFHLPSLVKRSLKYRDFTNYDLNKGILQLSSISESKCSSFFTWMKYSFLTFFSLAVCSDFISGPQNVRVLQWNILSQCKNYLIITLIKFIYVKLFLQPLVLCMITLYFALMKLLNGKLDDTVLLKKLFLIVLT